MEISPYTKREVELSPELYGGLKVMTATQMTDDSLELGSVQVPMVSLKAEVVQSDRKTRSLRLAVDVASGECFSFNFASQLNSTGRMKALTIPFSFGDGKEMPAALCLLRTEETAACANRFTFATPHPEPVISGSEVRVRGKCWAPKNAVQPIGRYLALVGPVEQIKRLFSVLFGQLLLRLVCNYSGRGADFVRVFSKVKTGYERYFDPTRADYEVPSAQVLAEHYQELLRETYASTFLPSGEQQQPRKSARRG